MTGEDRQSTFEVPDAKLVDYLLNVSHPKGGPKARFFVMFGFRADTPLVFAQALAAVGGSVRYTDVSGRRRMIVEGMIETPDGRRPRVRVVWQDEDCAWRLVTAVPLTR